MFQCRRVVSKIRESADWNGALDLFYRRHFEMPTPNLEGLDLVKGNRTWHCGYRTKAMLKAFVKAEELQALMTYGYKVYKITAKEVQIGNFQVVFRKPSIIKKEDITKVILQQLS